MNKYSTFIYCGFLAACSIQTDIQSRYIGERDNCRNIATLKQQTIGVNESLSSSGRDAQLLTFFSECMFKQGWTVASPNVGQPTAPLDPEDVVRSTETGRARPVQNPPVANTPLSLDENAPINIQEPTPMQQGIPGGSAQNSAIEQPVLQEGDVSISRSGVPVYEAPGGGAATGDPTRTMEEEFIRANNRRR